MPVGTKTPIVGPSGKPLTNPVLPIALSSSISGALERMEEFANSSIEGDRVKVLSEFDAVIYGLQKHHTPQATANSSFLPD